MVSGTNSANKNMKMLVKELEIDGQPVTGGGSAPDASAVTFTSGQGLTATDVAAALDELKALIDALP